MTETLQAIRAKCERMLAHAEREPGQFMSSQVAAYNTTIAALDALRDMGEADAEILGANIIAAWEGLP